MSQNANFTQTLGIDLIKAAKNELEFLKLVDEYPNLCKGSVVKNAIRRYELFWLPLASRFGTETALTAPLDIEWVWHVHMLAPSYYERDCLNIISKVLDHSLLDDTQRNLALQWTEYFWYIEYAREPFEVDLTKPSTVLTEYRSRIQYNLEEACYRQFKFYYQVSLPHYSDDLFLKGAVERYEHHLQLQKLHPDVSMVPCYDVELIWHTHQLHPLNYKRTTAELLGKPLHHDGAITGRTPGTKPYDSDMKKREAWEAAGLPFAKAGTMYRGDPPDPRPPTPKWLYTPLAYSKYSCEIQKVEVLGLKRMFNYAIEVESLGRAWKFFYQDVRKNNRANDSSLRPSNDSSLRPFVLDNDTKHMVIVSLHKSTLFGMKSIAESQVDFLPYFQAVGFNDTALNQPIVIDVLLCSGRYTAKLTTKFELVIIKDYCFRVQPPKTFWPRNHPSKILSCPKLMLPPNDLAKASVPCDSATHSVICGGYEVFSYRVVHSSEALLSALDIINLYGQAVASAHTINPSTFPERRAVEDQNNNIFLSQDEGERAMLIRGSRDWAVCIGGLKKTSISDEEVKGWPHYVDIRVYKLFGERGWCSVRKSRHGVFVIELDSDTMVQVDLKLNKVVISPLAQNIPQILALAFSMSVLHPVHSLPPGAPVL
ncbi:hypothetical protein ACROYT_G015867 [Oculina patagonica]